MAVEGPVDGADKGLEEGTLLKPCSKATKRYVPKHLAT